MRSKPDYVEAVVVVNVVVVVLIVVAIHKGLVVVDKSLSAVRGFTITFLQASFLDDYLSYKKFLEEGANWVLEIELNGSKFI